MAQRSKASLYIQKIKLLRMIEHKKDLPYYDREMSWVQFNGRVLQEAEDANNPLIERLRFLAIFSSNLDEFYRVRIASLRSLIRLKKKERKELAIKPKKLLVALLKTIDKQQRKFGDIYRKQLLPALEREGIYLQTEQSVNESQRNYLLDYYRNRVAEHIIAEPLRSEGSKPFLTNNQLYFYAKTRSESGEEQRWILKIPTNEVGRYISVDEGTAGFHVMVLDDLIRMALPEIFPDWEVEFCHSFKVNRDGDLYLEDEYGQSVVEKIHKGLKKREYGLPSRFLYDPQLPKEELKLIMDALDLEDEDLMPGGKYHNFSDLWDFPFPPLDHLTYPPQPALNFKAFDTDGPLWEVIQSRDYALHFPYQSYDYVVRFLEEAAADPQVKTIKMTLYRVAGKSLLCKALIKAAEAGKQVMVFDEVQARFDEESNLYWGKELEKAGAQVLYSCEGLKVHSKLCLVEREIDGQKQRQALLATGNFNEKTARIYCDIGYFTARAAITEEVARVFEMLHNPHEPHHFDHLLVAPHQLRDRFNTLIDNEIEAAQQGRKAEIFAKMNSLQDKKIIARLYNASQAGVKVRLLVRGICVAVPGMNGISENIRIRSIVGRYLEHARIFYFHNGGEPAMYAASADWMTRNLNRRVEVGFPISDGQIWKDLLKMLNLQWDDNQKGRKINIRQNNPYCKVKGKKKIESQSEFYHYLRELYS